MSRYVLHVIPSFACERKKIKQKGNFASFLRRRRCSAETTSSSLGRHMAHRPEVEPTLTVVRGVAALLSPRRAACWSRRPRFPCERARACCGHGQTSHQKVQCTQFLRNGEGPSYCRGFQELGLPLRGCVLCMSSVCSFVRGWGREGARAYTSTTKLMAGGV